ncbi:MAG: MarR family transcriptional regulator [Streptosporangiaceae bacterium]
MSGENGVSLQSFAVQLRRMNSEFNRIAHEFAQAHGLHPTDVQALIAILDAPNGLMTPGRLREQLNLSSGAITACLDRLERAGHVRRTRDPHDRRVVHLHYESAAREIASVYFRPLARSTDAARSPFSPAEQQTILLFLESMNEELTTVRST